MKLSIFHKTLILAIFLHLIVFVGIYLGLFGVFAEVGGNFCEAAREGLIKQPANTVSNIAFALFGLLAAHQLTNKKFEAANALTTSSFVAIFFTSLMVALSPGSMAMHATETYLGGYFDMLSMYFIAAFLVTYGMERLFLLKPSYFVLTFALILVVCHVFHFMPRDIKFPLVGFGGNFIFAIFILLSVILEFVNHYLNKTSINIRWGYGAVGVFLLSFMIWFTGRDAHPWCHPYSFIQAHAVWHILDATALYFAFRFFVSEQDQRFVRLKQ